MFGFKKTIGYGKEPEPVEENPGGDQNAQTLQSLQEMLKQVMGNQERLQTKILSIESQRGQPPAAAQAPAAEAAPSRKKVSGMTQEELDELMPGEVYKMLQDDIQSQLADTLDKKINPIVETLTGFMRNTHQTQVKDRVMVVAQEAGPDGKPLRPDFGDWVDELKAARQAMPQIDIAQLYDLVRVQNPGKAKQLEAKYVPVPEQSLDNVLDFGGIPPNLMRQTVDGGDLSIEDAASQALEETRSTHGELPQAGSM